MKRWISATALLLLLFVTLNTKAAGPDLHVGTWFCNSFFQNGQPVESSGNMTLTLQANGVMELKYNDQVLPGTYTIKAEQGTKGSVITLYTSALGQEKAAFVKMIVNFPDGKTMAAQVVMAEGQDLSSPDQVVTAKFTRQ